MDSHRKRPRVAALCGGVGGAKLADGLARRLGSARLSVVVNTGDDFQHYGLHVSPDVDTVLYTLAGLANPRTGWGLAGDTGRVGRALRRLGDDVWFNLGDRDLATHMRRTAWRAEGVRPAEITRRLAQAMGVRAAVIPMSDTPVSTLVETVEGDFEFQEWFVRRRCTPAAIGARFVGAADAALPPEAGAALDDADLVVLCPSNPYLSIGPILAVPGVLPRLKTSAAPVVGVSPIVGGRAVKGPTARMLADLAGEASAAAVAAQYAEFLDGFVVDVGDSHAVASRVGGGIAVHETDVLMRDGADRARLAGQVLAFGARLGR